MDNQFIEGLLSTQDSTLNGAITRSTTNDAILDLFFKAGGGRFLPEEDIILLISKAFATNPNLALRTIFWSGDIRKGLGERRFFKVALKYLYDNYPKTFKKNFKHVPFFNRWDSLFDFGRDYILDFIHENLISGDNLLKKWLPRKQQFNNLAGRLRKRFKIAPQDYRKMLSSVNVIENSLCNRDYENIEYDKIPSVAFKKYRKAFIRNDEVRFEKFLDDVKDGKEKINAGAIFPHDIVKYFMINGDSSIRGATVAQWNNLPNLVKSGTSILPVCDVSGSMYEDELAIYVAVALSILISEQNNNAFKDYIMTFSEKPKLELLVGDVCQKIEQLKDTEWGYNTNLVAVFDTLLKMAIDRKVPQEDMPKKIIILSDMEFDEACEENNLSNFEEIARRYKEFGYEKPDLIFWNISTKLKDNYPVRSDESGTALVSGYSQNILKAVLGDDLSPERIMLDVLLNTRYDILEV